jgi:hypothetical protein
VIENIFQVANEAVQLAFVEFSLTQVPIEIRSATLRVSIPLDLLFVSPDLLDVSIVSEIRGLFEMGLHSSNQVAPSGIRNILG